jgi:hypothetical protein
MENRISKTSKILSLTRDTFESSSIHAIPNIIRNKFLLIKIVWFICFVFSFGGCAWFIIRSINDYLKYDVVTSVRVKYQNELTFPVIGICNLNFFNKDLANQIIRQKAGSNKPDMITFFVSRFLTYNLYKNNNNIIDFNPNDVIINCAFGSSEICNKTNDFELYFDLQYGACLKYNSVKSMNGDQLVDQKKSYSSGLLSGLELELFIGDVDQNENMYSKEHGFVVFVHNQSNFDSYDLEGINISPGTSTKISLSKHSWIKEPQPYSECTDDLTSPDSYSSPFYKESFRLNKSYSYYDCFYMCYQNFIQSICNCSLVMDDKNFRLCFLDENYRNKDLYCTGPGYEKFSMSYAIKRCDCPIECKKTYYTHTSSVSLFPTLKYYDYLMDSDLVKRKYPNMTYEKLKKSVARVQIFYDKMEETVIEESVKTELSDLISNLGGTLGLFLGLSFLSLIEFVEALLQALFVLFNNNNNNQTKPMSSKHFI